MILASIGKITDIIPVLDKYNFKSKLSKKDKSRLNSIIHEEDQNRMLVSRFLLAQLLIQNGLINSSIDQLNFDTYGKPYLKDLFVSISHSGDMAGTAISSSEKIGIDIQKHKNISLKDYNSILTKKEIEFSNKLEPGQKMKWFFDIWCRKEAIMKADGRGMSIEPDSVLLNDEY